MYLSRLVVHTIFLTLVVGSVKAQLKEVPTNEPIYGLKLYGDSLFGFDGNLGIQLVDSIGTTPFAADTNLNLLSGFNSKFFYQASDKALFRYDLKRKKWTSFDSIYGYKPIFHKGKEYFIGSRTLDSTSRKSWRIFELNDTSYREGTDTSLMKYDQSTQGRSVARSTLRVSFSSGTLISDGKKLYTIMWRKPETPISSDRGSFHILEIIDPDSINHVTSFESIELQNGLTPFIMPVGVLKDSILSFQVVGRESSSFIFRVNMLHTLNLVSGEVQTAHGTLGQSILHSEQQVLMAGHLFTTSDLSKVESLASINPNFNDDSFVRPMGTNQNGLIFIPEDKCLEIWQTNFVSAERIFFDSRDCINQVSLYGQGNLLNDSILAYHVNRSGRTAIYMFNLKSKLHYQIPFELSPGSGPSAFDFPRMAIGPNNEYLYYAHFRLYRIDLPNWSEGIPFGHSDPFDGGEFTLYPNPCTDQLMIKSTIVFDRLIIYDSKGTALKKMEQKEFLGKRIDLSFLNPGIYYFSFETQNHVLHRKVIKE